MGAPVGNNYWQFRNKHGRDHKYTPDRIWEEFIEYYKWVENTPWFKNEAIKGGERAGDIIQIPTKKPLAIGTFCIFADISEQTFLNYEKKDDFVEVITRIRGIIEGDQLEGATVGAYNANIIARKLGLGDKLDLSNKGGKFESSNIIVSDKKTAKNIQSLIDKFESE